jgi:hypothetical protein
MSGRGPFLFLVSFIPLSTIFLGKRPGIVFLDNPDASYLLGGQIPTLRVVADVGMGLPRSVCNLGKGEKLHGAEQNMSDCFSS